MEVKSVLDTAGRFIKKYQYVFLIVVIGIVLLMIPSRKKSQEHTITQAISNEESTKELEDKLGVILSKINGAGKVEVLLTFFAGEEYVFQTNEDSNTSTDKNEKQVDTVLITDSNRTQTGLVRKTLAPTYRGAVVICEGADNPAVQLAIVDAVADATGLSTNHISVLKMK